MLDFTVVELFRHQLSIVVHQDDLLAKKRNLHLADLKRERLIFIKKELNPSLHMWLKRKCHASGFSPNIVHEIHHQYDHAALVQHRVGIGLGFGFWKNWRNRELFPNLVLRTFTASELAIDIAMLFSEKFNFHPLRRFVSAVQQSRAKTEEDHGPLALTA